MKEIIYIERECPVCGSNEIFSLLAGQNIDISKINALSFASRKLPELMHHRMVVCANCDLAYANPVPNNEWLKEEYVYADFDSMAESIYAAKSYVKLLSGIEKKLLPKSGILDIGTGDGAFLNELSKHGYNQFMGVEPSRAPVRQASDKIQPYIKESFFDSEDFTPRRFNFVTCFQTLEHVTEPLSLCLGAYKLLKPGGAFLCVVHNYRSFSARLMGAKSPIFDIEHLQLFSPQSIKSMLVRTGFIDINIRSFVNSYPISYWLKLIYLPHRIKKVTKALLSTFKLTKFVMPLRAGNLAAVGFRPLE